jgi:glycosyltransferase involved in cell wall biosynthesis
LTLPRSQEHPGTGDLRVLQVIDDLGAGGGQRQLVDLAPALRALGTDVRVLALGGDQTFAAVLQQHGIPVRSLGAESRGDLARAVLDIHREIQRFRPDVLHTRLALSPMIARLATMPRPRRLRHVCSVGAMWYSSVQTLDNPAHSMRKTEVLRQADRWTGRAAAVTYVASSQAVAQMLRARLGVPAHHVHVIHNSTPLAPPTPGTPVERRSPVGRLITVGRLSPEKGHRYLVDAVALLRDRGVEVSLLVVGSGPLEQDLRRQVAAHRLDAQVTILGTSTEVPRLLGESDLFVFPSLHEGFGVVVIEAMAARVPVVVSDIAPMREILGEHDPCGLLVPPRDAGRLADAVAEALDPTWAAATADRAYQRVREAFSVAAGAAKYRALYDRLTAASDRP